MQVDAAGAVRAQRYWDAIPGHGIAAHGDRGLDDAARERFYVDGIRQRLRDAVSRGA